MSKFLGCVTDAVASGELDKDLADEVREAYDDAVSALGSSVPPTEADRLAGQAAMTALERKALEAKRHRILSMRTRRAALASAGAYKRARGYTDVKDLGGGSGKPPKDGWNQGGRPPPKGPWREGGAMADWLKELVDGEGGLAGGAGPSVKGQYQAIVGDFQSKMAALMDTFEEVSGLGLRNRALLDHVVDEAFGRDTGDAAAKALAKAWGDTAEYARTKFNAAGGAIGKLEGWGMPQTHDVLAVRAAGREAWVEATLPLLARGRMIDHATDMPFSDKRLRVVLGEAWDTLVSRGAVDRDVGESLGIGKVASQRQEHRFLIFDGPEKWRAYQQQFGAGDPYSAMMRHLDGMARDIARMHVLGPNPDHQFEWLANVALRDAQVEQAQGAPAQRGLKQAQGDVDSARRMMGLFTGELASPYGADNMIARAGGAIRAGLAGVQLGSAVINDLTSNPVFAGQVRAFAGLTGTPDFKAWFAHVTTPQARQMARRSGFILESARVRHAEAVQRFLRAETVGGKISEGANAFARMLPTWVYRASALEPNRNAARWSFQHEFMGRLHDLRDKSLAALEAGDDSERATAAILKARGFTSDEWDQIRASPPDTPEDGADFLSPAAVAAHAGDELGWRVAELIERETRQAVPEPSLWAQAQLLGSTRPGSIQGEIVRSMAAYRSFTVTQTYRWSREFMMRGLQAGEAGGLPWHLRAAGLAAPMLTAATLSGFLAIWLKDMVKGNDPRPVWDGDDPEAARKRLFTVTAQAMAQGGGQGILGDFLTSVEARNGKTSPMTALGAPAGFISDTWNLTGGNIAEAIEGEETNAGRETARYLARYAPLSTLWWSRTAWDRAVADQLQRTLDPEAEAAFRRQARRLEREQGQGQWWPEGQAAPARAPDVAGVVGAR